MKTINNLLKKILMAVLIIAVVLTLSACGGPPQDGKNHWRIDEKDIMNPWWRIMPRAMFGEHDDFREKDYQTPEAAKILFGFTNNNKICISGTVSYKVVKSGERYLEAPDTGAFYFPDTEAFAQLEQGIKPPELRLWYVYTDNKGVARCYEAWIGLDWYSYIHSAGPHQTLTLNILNGVNYTGFSNVDFILSSIEDPYAYIE